MSYFSVKFMKNAHASTLRCNDSVTTHQMIMVLRPFSSTSDVLLECLNRFSIELFLFSPNLSQMVHLERAIFDETSWHRFQTLPENGMSNIDFIIADVIKLLVHCITTLYTMSFGQI